MEGDAQNDGDRALIAEPKVWSAQRSYQSQLMANVVNDDGVTVPSWRNASIGGCESFARRRKSRR